MDRRPLIVEIGPHEQEWAMHEFSWSHLWEQVEEAKEGKPFEEGHVKLLLELVARQLRTADYEEWLHMANMLGIEYNIYGTPEVGDIKNLLNHQHGDWTIVGDDEVSSLPTWKVACGECAEQRRIVRI